MGTTCKKGETMELDEFNKLEEKVKYLVENLKHLKVENENLKEELTKLKKESSLKNEERSEIRKKVTTLIQLIDSLESS